MGSKRVLLAVTALFLIASSTAFAGSVSVNNFQVARLEIVGPNDWLNMQSVDSWGIVSGTPTTPIPTAYDTIYMYVANGYNGGAWNGGQAIRSSVAAADLLHASGLALVSGDDYRNVLFKDVFHNHVVKLDDSLIRYTYYGDANLDGVVDAKDFAQVEMGQELGGSAAGLSGWAWGDFNYDGAIDSRDHDLLNYVDSLHLPPLDPVPEPSTIALLVTASLGGLFWWRRRFSRK
jgi:hypothetical protein